MLRVVSWSARHPLVILLTTALVVVAGYFVQKKLPRDAIPDLSDPQIVLIVEWMGHPATEVSDKVTDVVTEKLADLPHATAVRGTSMAGMAYVDVVLDDASATHAAHVEIARRLQALTSMLPPAARVRLGPEATSTGWIFQYALLPPENKQQMPMAEAKHESEAKQLAALRRFQDTVLAPRLAKIPGVAEVAPIGGNPDELVIETTADELRAAGVAFSDVASSVRAALASDPKSSPESMQNAPLTGPGGEKRLLGSVSRVRATPAMASGVADVDGATRAVGGIVIAKRNADVRAVIDEVKLVLDREKPNLPRGSTLGVVYDRSELASGVENTLLRAVGEEVLMVVLVVLVFLVHLRSALVPLITLPLVVLTTFVAMRFLGVHATVMSVGGIAIALGLAVDAELVALEACHRKLEGDGASTRGAERRSRLVAASASFAPAILTSLLIAACAFLPVFAFGGETGRLLRPLAITKTVVIVVAALVALTVAPALRDRLLRGRVLPEAKNPVTSGLVRLYRPFVNFALARPAFTLVTAALAALSCVPILSKLGSEFLPRIDEGDLLYMPTTAPGIPPGEAVQELVRQDLDIAERPEVALVFGKIGRAETATDPASFSMAETTIRLKPRSEWPKLPQKRWYSDWAPAPMKRALGFVWPEHRTATTAELVEGLDKSTRFPGWTNAWTAPVRARMDMMATGVRTPVGVRVIAGNPRRLDELGGAVQAAVTRVPETTSATYESLGGEPRFVFEPDAEALARYGVDAERVRETAEVIATGGELGAPTTSIDGRAPRRVRLSLSAPWFPKRLQDLVRDATVRSGRDGTGQPVPLALLGRLRFVDAPAVLHSEKGELSAYVHVDVANGTDLNGYVGRARADVDRALAGGDVRLLPNERVEWTGQYALIAAGERRLALIAPLVALSMLGLLLLQFRSIAKALIVLASVPFALVGSFWTLYLLDYRLSAPVWVGLLSVVGLAMQTGVLMIVYIDDAFERRVREGRMRNRQDIIEAHAEGTVLRLRPKIMTIATMGASLLPLLWSQGAGSEIMRRVAAPMVGGLVTSAFLTLEVLPVLYTIWRTRQLETARARAPVPDAAPAE